jgi:hypothetical protein
MNPAERENIIGILAWHLTYSTKVLEAKSDEELEKLYQKVEGK